MFLIYNIALTAFICFLGTSIIVLVGNLGDKSVIPPLSPVNLLFGYGLGFIILLKAVHILGVFGLFDFKYIVMVLVVLLLISTFIYIRVWKVYKPTCVAYKLEYKRLSRLEWLLLGIILFVIVLIFIADLNPPRHADAMRYHLVYPKIVVDTGRISFVPNWFLSLATDAELFFACCMALIGLDSVKPMIFITAVLCLVGTYELAKEYVSNEMTALFVVVLTTMSPIFFAATTIVKPDVFQLLFLVLAMNALIVFESTKNWIYAILAALFLGEMFALKWHGAIPLFAFGTVLVILNQPFGMSRKEGLIFLSVLGCAIAILPIGWYLRNYINTGNPIWPLLDNIFNKGDMSFLHEIASYSAVRVAKDILGIYQTFFVYPPGIIGGMGPIILAFFIPGFISSDFKHRSSFILFVSAYLICWYVSGGSFRFTIWLLPFMAITAAKSIKAFLECKKRFLRYLCITIVAVGISVQLGFASVYSGLYVKHLFGLVSDDEYFMTVPHYFLFQRTRDEVNKKPGRVLVILPSSETFYLNVDYISGDPQLSAIIDYSAINDVAQLKRLFTEKEVTYILIENSYLEKSRRLKFVKELIETNCELIFQMEDEIISNRLLGTYRKERVSLYFIKR